MTIEVTVLSVFHNRESGVDLSLQSLRDQDCRSFRAVVVDDESSDATYERLKSFESDIMSVRRQRNTGFTQTMINLCNEAETEFIAVHGAGDESLPSRLTAQLAFLRANPSVVAVGCGIENVDEISGKRWDVLPRERIKRGPITGDFGISHGEIMFRRSAYLAAGGYRAIFPVGQATDLFRRMSRLGDFGYVDRILYRRYLRLDGVSARIDKVAQREILAAISMAVHMRAIRAADAPVRGRLQDDLDRYGLLLPYFAAPDRGIAINLAKAATKMWSAGDRALALRLARKSLAERWTRQGLLSYGAILMGTGPLAAPLLRLVTRMSGGRAELSLARLQASAAPSERSPDTRGASPAQTQSESA